MKQTLVFELSHHGFRVTFDVCSFLSQEGGSRGSAVNFKKLKSDFRGHAMDDAGTFGVSGPGQDASLDRFNE